MLVSVCIGKHKMCVVTVDKHTHFRYPSNNPTDSRPHTDHGSVFIERRRRRSYSYSMILLGDPGCLRLRQGASFTAGVYDTVCDCVCVEVSQRCNGGMDQLYKCVCVCVCVCLFLCDCVPLSLSLGRDATETWTVSTTSRSRI